MSRRSHRERHRPDRYGDWDLRSKSSSTASSTSSIRRRKAQLELEAAEQLAQLGQREIDLQRQLIQKRLELAQEELDEATRLPLPPSESASTRSRLSDARLNEWIADQQLQPTEQQPTGGEKPIVKVETPRQVDLDLQTAQPELVHVASSSQDLPDRHQSAILDGMATTVATDNMATLATTSRSTAIWCTLGKCGRALITRVSPFFDVCDPMARGFGIFRGFFSFQKDFFVVFWRMTPVERGTLTLCTTGFALLFEVWSWEVWERRSKASKLTFSDMCDGACFLVTFLFWQRKSKICFLAFVGKSFTFNLRPFAKRLVKDWRG